MHVVVVWIVQAFMWVMRSKLGYFIAAALLWLGINITAVTVVVQPAIDMLTAMANNAGSAQGDLGAVAFQWMGVLRFDQALTMIISAYATRNLIHNGRIMFFKLANGT